MHLKDIMLREISLSKKEKFFMFFLYGVQGVVTVREKKGKRGVAGGGGGGNGEILFDEYRVSFLQDEKTSGD